MRMKHQYIPHPYIWASSGGSVVKNPPAKAGDPSSIPGSWRSPGEGHGFLPGKSHKERSLAGYSSWSHKRVGHDLATKIARHPYMWASLVSLVKSLPANAGDTGGTVRSLGREDHLEEEMATHPSILAGKIPWTEEPGKPRPWGCKESDTAEHACTHPYTTPLLNVTGWHSSVRPFSDAFFHPQSLTRNAPKISADGYL